jgi:hypothetical protein
MAERVYAGLCALLDFPVTSAEFVVCKMLDFCLRYL